MKRTLRFVALAAVVALTSWVTNVEATEATAELKLCMASQDLGSDQQDGSPGAPTYYPTCREIYDQCTAGCSPEDQLCFQECQCQFFMCRGYPCN